MSNKTYQTYIYEIGTRIKQYRINAGSEQTTVLLFKRQRGSKAARQKKSKKEDAFQWGDEE